MATKHCTHFILPTAQGNFGSRNCVEINGTEVVGLRVLIKKILMEKFTTGRNGFRISRKRAVVVGVSRGNLRKVLISVQVWWQIFN